MSSYTTKKARVRSPFEDPADLIDFDAALKCTTKNDRVDFVVLLMADGRYVTGATIRLLAEAWGLSTWTVEEYAKAAAAALRVLLGGHKEIRERAVAVIDRIHTESLERARTVKSQKTAAAFYRVSLEAARGMMAFADRQVDESRFDNIGKPTETPTFKTEIVAPERPKEVIGAGLPVTE